MPKLEQGMQQGVLLAWLVDEGEAVSAGEPVAEIESEKTTTEIEARDDGVLRRIFVEAGETVAPGTPLGVIAKPDESIEEIIASVETDDGEPSESTARGADRKDTDVRSETPSGGDNDTPESSDAATADPSSGGQSRKVSPGARRLADDLDVDLSTIDGTGPGGAIVTEDVEQAAEDHGDITVDARRRAKNLGVDPASITGTGPESVVTVSDVEAAVDGVRKRRELTGMRRTIGERLGRSHREAPHVTVHRDVRVDALLEATAVADRHVDPDVTITDLLLIAISATLTDHPTFNGHFEDDVHTIFETQDVGVAVDIDDGLVTPVIDALETLTVAELAAKRDALTTLVLDGEYTSDDITGGTFTVTNLGVFGVDSFTPIINPPEVAILGVDRITEAPVKTDNGAVTFEPHIGFDFSFDHRVVDGADAARFLETLAGHVRDPLPLLLDRV